MDSGGLELQGCNAGRVYRTELVTGWEMTGARWEMEANTFRARWEI